MGIHVDPVHLGGIMGVDDPKVRVYPGLTDAKVKSAKATGSDYRLADAGGLRLQVTKTGHRSR